MFNESRPSLPSPDLSELQNQDEATRWALLPYIKRHWISTVSPQLGLDAKKMFLGSLLDDIEDTGNILSPIMPANRAPELHQQLSLRLTRQLSETDLPKKYQGQIGKGLPK